MYLRIILIALLALRVGATTYYVNYSGGSDDAGGTSPDAPWQSLAKVNAQQFGPGDSVLLRGGESWTGTLSPSGAGSESAPVVFGRYGDGTSLPHIGAGGATESVILKDFPDVIFEDFRLTNHAESPLRRARGIYLFASDGCTVDNVTVQRCEFVDIIGDSRQATRYLNGAIFTDSDGSGHFTRLRILDNHIHDNTVRGITGDQSATNWEDPATMHDSVTIAGNLIDNIGADGIRVIASRNVLVEHNTVYRCGANNAGMELNYIAACFPQQCINTLWQFNEVAYTAHTNPSVGDEDSEAFDIDWGCAGTHVFQYNYTHDNVGGFFLFMGKIVGDHAGKVGLFEKAVIRYNVSVNDGVREPIPRICEIHPFDGATFPILFYNNTFYNRSEIDIHLKNGGDYPGVEFHNNIFDAPAASYPTQALVYSHNLYHGHSPASADGDAVTGNPNFASAGSSDDGMDGAMAYRIADASAALGAGHMIADNGSRDFWGDPLPGGPLDIGADQHSGVVTTAAPRLDHAHAGRLDVSRLPGALRVSGLTDQSAVVYVLSPDGRVVRARASGGGEALVRTDGIAPRHYVVTAAGTRGRMSGAVQFVQ